LNIAKRVEDIGFYAGFVGKLIKCIIFWWYLIRIVQFRLFKFTTNFHFSCTEGGAFMLGRALTSVFWGLVADRWGRKPVIVIGLISVSVLLIFYLLVNLSFPC